jgi:hypothetical protein
MKGEPMPPETAATEPTPLPVVQEAPPVLSMTVDDAIYTVGKLTLENMALRAALDAAREENRQLKETRQK